MAKNMETARTPVTLDQAIAEEAYEWLARQAPRMIEAIENELRTGSSPNDIRRIVSMNVGPERAGMALRCYQAAMYLTDYHEA